ncbi:MAG: Type 3 secretion system secretin [Chlamydiia bacterium]|nr:Type 3 secretion system secretin [Chlamydiia bacterium]
MLKNYKHFILFTSLFISINLFSLSLEDKRKEILNRQTNFDQSDLSDKNTQIKTLYEKLEKLYKESTNDLITTADESLFTKSHDQIMEVRKEITDIENAWKSDQQKEFSKGSDDFGIWELGEVTISKLVIEYGSCDSLYVIPPEIAKQKVTLHCLLSIPKESWPKMIDLILTHNNIGVKKVNPFVKQLFLLKDDFTNVENISSNIDHLKNLDDNSRIIFVYTPPIENIKTSFYFLDKFKNAKSTFVYQVGSKIAMVGLVRDINKLVTLAENVWDRNEERVSKIISPTKITAKDAVKLLKSYFGGLTDYSRPMISTKGGNNLSAFTLKGEDSLILIGPKELVEQAETLIRKTETQISNPNELTLYTYTCCHCKPAELAEILSKIYTSLITLNVDKNKSSDPKTGDALSDGGYPYLYKELPSYYKSPATVLEETNKLISQQKAKEQKPDNSFKNFFPFPTTDTLLMVVRKDTLAKIKQVIKKLDTPKKMVEIEVLLCERRINNENKSGINLLKLADSASNTDDTGFSYDGSGSNKGFMEFIFNKKESKNHLPALDLTYNFLMSQDDVYVTASPSTTTLNQIPTTISITDQISIDMGANKNDAAIYTREDIGIVVTITPTVHDKHSDDPYGTTFITLENKIQFDSINSNNNDRPSVHRRHIENTVRIPDGQTVIIGGLRASNTEDSNQKIPFLGEIPGLAKIFGTSSSKSKNNEMFIFIKPKVINDPATDLLRIRENRLKKRQGDSDLMLKKINESRKYEEKKRFEESFKLFFCGSTNDQSLK